jgi:hypothetical protein
MTATVTEEVAPEATADASAPVAPKTTEPKVIPVPLDEFGHLAFAKLSAQIEEYNKLAKVVKAVEGDPSGMLDEFRASYTEDDTVNKIRTAIEELDNKREQLMTKQDEILKPLIAKTLEDKKATIGDAPEKLKVLGSSIRQARGWLSSTYCEEAIEDLPALEGKGKSTAKGSGSTGGRRIRGYDFFVDGKRAVTRNQEGKESSSAAAVALHMKKEPYSTKLETEDVRQAFWGAAGTDDPDKYPNELSFTLPYGEGENAKVASVTAKRVSDGDTE